MPRLLLIVGLISIVACELHARGYGDFDTGEGLILSGIHAPDLANRSFSMELWIRNDRNSESWAVRQDDLSIGYTDTRTFSFTYAGNTLNVGAESYGIWVHWTCVYNADTGKQRVYKNGQLEGERDATAFAGSGDFQIGVSQILPQVGWTGLFNGGVDDVRLWDRALTTPEIAARYGRDLTPSEVNDGALLLYLPMNTTFEDGSSFQRDVLFNSTPTLMSLLDRVENEEATPTHTLTLASATLNSLWRAIDEANTITVSDPNAYCLIDLSTLTNITLAFDGAASAFLTRIDVNSRIKVQGAPGLIIDAASSGARPFKLLPGATLVLKDLVIRNGSQRGANGSASVGGFAGMGGACFVSYGAHLSAEDVTFENNVASGGDGGAAHTTDGGDGGRGGYYYDPFIGSTKDVASSKGGSVGAANGGNGGAFRAGTPGYAGGTGGAGGSGAHGYSFSQGGRGLPGAGGGGGGAIWPESGGGVGGDGGRGGAGGHGGNGGFGSGGSGGGPGGGGGGGGTDNKDSEPEHGDPLAGGAGGSGGRGGFGAGDGKNGLSGARGQGYAIPKVFREEPGFPGGQGGAASGPGGGGAGLGGALFVGSRATARLIRVHFANNVAQGGRGGAGNSILHPNGGDGHGIGGAAFFMGGAYAERYRDVTEIGNEVLTHSGSSDSFAPEAIYGIPDSPAVAIRQGRADNTSRPLYFYDAENVQPGSANSAAFRFRWLLYGLGDHDGLSNTPTVPVFNYPLDSPLTGTPIDPDISNLFTAADETAIGQAHDAVVAALEQFPDDEQLRELLLDICHDGARMHGFLAGYQADKAERDAQLVEPLLQSSLNAHIAAYEPTFDGDSDSVLDRYARALACYRQLFVDPLHYSVFSTDLPLRDFEPLRYLDSSNQPQPITPSDGFTEGYRDLTVLFDLMAAYGQAAYRLAELYHARNWPSVGIALPSDITLGAEVASQVERILDTNGLLLKSLAPSEGIVPELDAAIQRWESVSENLGAIQTRLKSGINGLGFSDDFLLLLAGGTHPDTYDELYERIDGSILGDETIPGSAMQLLEQGRSRFDAYNASRDHYDDRRADLLTPIQNRLDEIGGNEGGTPGEIDNQLLSLANAKQQIERNSLEIENLLEEIVIATAANDQLKDINTEMGEIQVHYLNTQRDLDKEISNIETAQKGADWVASLFNPAEALSTVQKVVKVGNFLFQAGAEAKKSSIEDEKVQLAGAEIMELTGKENEKLDVELEKFISTRMLDMKLLKVDSIIAANTMAQEYNRLAALIAEKQRLEGQRFELESGAALADRFYGDPLHQLRAEAAIGDAAFKFRHAKLWSYALLRALEYKWNQPFDHTDFEGNRWTVQELYAARNAHDLRAVVDAMATFNTNREDDYGVINDDPPTFIFLRSEFFGYEDDQMYPDPITGVSVDATTAFQSRLVQMRDDTVQSFNGEVKTPFHTVRTFGDSFFQGVVYQEQPPGSGNYGVFIAGVALDKINWTKVVLLGDFGGAYNPIFAQNKLANTTLTYGGTTYVRRIQVGTLAPGSPDRLLNELVPYETRTYDLASGSFPPPISRNYLSDTINALVYDTSIGNNPSLLAEDGFANQAFADRSVAATDWTLSLIVDPGNGTPFPVEKIEDIILIINHRSYDRTDPD